MNFRAASSALALCGSLAAMFTMPLAASATSQGTARGLDRGQDGAVVVRASGLREDGIGAGTIVAIGSSAVEILTAKHVAVYGALTVHFAEGDSAPAHILRLVAGRDLAVIEADVDPAVGGKLHAAPLAAPRDHASVHIWGSGYNGPALESAEIPSLGKNLPDGAAHGRYALDCALCHRGDSGGGIFDGDGNLVGVFVGYFTLADGQLPVAESVDSQTQLAVASTPKTDRSNVSSMPSAKVVSALFASTTL